MKTTTMTLALAAIAASGVADAAEIHWTGNGNSTDATMAANWDGTNAFPKEDKNYSLVIDKDGATVQYQSANWNGGQHGPLTVGSVENPRVNMVFVSVRKDSSGNISNADTAGLNIDGLFTVTGANTTIEIREGFCLRLKGSFANPCWAISDDSTFTGAGVLQFQNGSVIPGRDYGDLWIYLGYDNGWEASYTLGGNLVTTGKIRLSHDSLSGDRLVKFDLAGKSVSAGAVELGALDMHSSEGNQSNFGGLNLNGGTIVVSGDFRCMSDPDGHQANGGAALTRDSYVTSSGNGGALSIGGDFVNTSKSPSLWNMTDVAVTLDGSSAQRFEVASEDRGASAGGGNGNYGIGSLTVAAGADVTLVDDYDNSRDTATAEAVYVEDLIVESGATLRLNGHNVYVTGSQSVEGTVVEDGGAITFMRTTKTVVVPLGPVDNSAGLGHWVGGIAIGDINGDGRNEICAFTIDENSTDDDGRLYAVNYSNYVAVVADNFPVSDKSLVPNVTFHHNAIVSDLGNGNGKELLFTAGSRSPVYAVNGNGAVRTVASNVCWNMNPLAIVDLDGDGSKELIAGQRGGTYDVNVVRSDTGALVWVALAPARDSIVAQIGVADLNRDKRFDVFAIGQGADGGISAYTNDGAAIANGLKFTSVTANDGTAGSLSAVDVDGDRKPEFVFAANGCGMGVMKQDGTTVFQVASGNYNGFALLDADGDGAYEILYGDTLYDGNGSVLDTLPVPSGCTWVCNTVAPVLADFNGDGIPEAVYLGASRNVQYGKCVAVYDFVRKEMLDGFPVALKAQSDDGNAWWAGQFQHWVSGGLRVADVDGDGTWEIIVGIGRAASATEVPAALNIIDTPYAYVIPEGAAVEDYGWYSMRHDERCSCAYPIRTKPGFCIFVR